MAPALRKTKRASEVAKRCSSLHPSSRLLTSLGTGKWTASNYGPSLIRYTLSIWLQFSKYFYLCQCFYVHTLQNNYAYAYRRLETNIRSSSLIPIFATVTNFHFLRRGDDGDGHNTLDFNKRNLQIVLNDIICQFKSNTKIRQSWPKIMGQFAKLITNCSPAPPPPSNVVTMLSC